MLIKCVYCEFKNPANAAFCVGCGTKDFNKAPFFSGRTDFPVALIILLTVLMAGIIAVIVFIHSLTNDPENLRSNINYAFIIGIPISILLSIVPAQIINAKKLQAARRESAASIEVFNLEKSEEEILQYIRLLEVETGELIDALSFDKNYIEDSDLGEEGDYVMLEDLKDFESDEEYDTAGLEGLFYGVGAAERQFYETVEAQLALRRVQLLEIYLLWYENEAVYWCEKNADVYSLGYEKLIIERIQEIENWIDEVYLGEGNRYFAVYSEIENDFIKRAEKLLQFYKNIDDGIIEKSAALDHEKVLPYCDEQTFSELGVKKLFDSYEKPLWEIRADYERLKAENRHESNFFG